MQVAYQTELEGHRKGIKSLSFASNDFLISASWNKWKIWNCGAFPFQVDEFKGDYAALTERVVMTPDCSFVIYVNWHNELLVGTIGKTELLP